jgi:tetratricopeptide (TPR) repeat protein
LGQATPINPGRRLDSWKEIAAFFGRDERTVRRWEKENELPVRRIPGSAKGRVFAYEGELREWLTSTPLAEEKTSEVKGSELVSIQSELHAPILSKLVPFVAKWAATLIIVTGLVAAVFVYRRMHRFAVQASSVPPVVSGGRDLRNPAAPEAEDFYLKGRYYWNKRTPDDINQAVDYFTQAIVHDPNYAEAYVGLADSYNLLREFGAMPPSEAYPRALAAAQRAVELDHRSAEAHNSLAFVTFWWSWHGVTAELEFKRALALNPNFELAHHWYATFLLGRHRLPEALDQIEQAQKLDPSSTAILADKGFLLWRAGNAEGLALLKQLEKAQPSLSSTHDYLGRIYWGQKDYLRALIEWRQVAELRHDKDGIALASAREHGFAAGGLGGLFERELPVMKEIVDRGNGSAFELAETFAALGRKREAINYLQIAFERRDAAMLMGDPNPVLQPIAEYQQLQTQVNQLLAQ